MAADVANEAPPGYVTQRHVARWAERAIFDHLRSLSIDEKLEHIKRFWRMAHEVQIAALAHRFPHESRNQLERRAAEMRLGNETVAALLAAGLRPPWEHAPS